MAAFNQYSDYYDLIYQDKNYEQESDYIKRLITKYGVSCKHILELGCGTGRHASYMANQFNIVAIDTSKEMLNYATRYDHLGIRFELGDVRNYRLNKTVDAVISLFHVASYQTEIQDLKDYFQTARLHLKPGGIFIFDCWYAPAVLFQKPEKRSKVVENNKLKITRDARPTLDHSKNSVSVFYDISVFDKVSKETHCFSEEHYMRYLFMDDITDLANQFQFKLVNASEWLTDKEPSCETWSVYFVLEAL